MRSRPCLRRTRVPPRLRCPLHPAAACVYHERPARFSICASPADPFDLAGARIQDVPKTRDEVLQASQVFTHGSRLLLGKKQRRLVSSLNPLGDFRIIYIAAHGIASDNDVRHAVGPGAFVAPGGTCPDDIGSPPSSAPNGSDSDLPRL